MDSNSGDDGLATVSDFPVHALPLHENLGFAQGGNVVKAGRAPYVLFLNPDATIDEPSLSCWVRVRFQLEAEGIDTTISSPRWTSAFTRWEPIKGPAGDQNPYLSEV